MKLQRPGAARHRASFLRRWSAAFSGPAMSERILGLGMDVIEPSRICAVWERRGERFLQRIYTSEEISYSLKGRNTCQRLAARWAAKEAFVKAVGSELTGIRWVDIELISSGDAPPRMNLHGRAAQRAQKMGVERILVSISHSHDVAAATVLLVGL